MLYADQKLEPSCSTKANPTSRKTEMPTLRITLYNVAFKTVGKKRLCLMNFTEVTLLLSSDEALRCVVLPSFVICFFCYYPTYFVKIKRDRQYEFGPRRPKLGFDSSIESVLE